MSKPQCQECRDDHGIASCRLCKAWVCAAHRWSTGRPEDGYYCVRQCRPAPSVVRSMPSRSKENLGREPEPVALEALGLPSTVTAFFVGLGSCLVVVALAHVVGFF